MHGYQHELISEASSACKDGNIISDQIVRGEPAARQTVKSNTMRNIPPAVANRHVCSGSYHHPYVYGDISTLRRASE